MDSCVLEALSYYYDIVCPLRKGWEAIHRKTNTKVFIRVLPITSSDTNETLDMSNREYLLTKVFDFPLFPAVYQIIECGKHAIFVSELCEAGDISNFIRMNGAQTEDFARQILSQIICSLGYIKTEVCGLTRILYSSNILLDKYLNIRIPMFLSRDVFSAPKLRDNQIPFLAPEYHLNQTFTQSSEIWSLGVLLFYIVSGTMPFVSSSKGHSLCMVLHDDPVYPLAFSKNFIDLLNRMLQKDPQQRINLEGVRDHPWLGHITFDTLTKYQLKDCAKKVDSYDDLKSENNSFTEEFVQSRIGLKNHVVEEMKNLRFEMVEKSRANSSHRPRKNDMIYTLVIPKIVQVSSFPRYKDKHVPTTLSRKVPNANRRTFDSISKKEKIILPETRYAQQNLIHTIR